LLGIVLFLSFPLWPESSFFRHLWDPACTGTTRSSHSSTSSNAGIPRVRPSNVLPEYASLLRI